MKISTLCMISVRKQNLKRDEFISSFILNNANNTTPTTVGEQLLLSKMCIKTQNSEYREADTVYVFCSKTQLDERPEFIIKSILFPSNVDFLNVNNHKQQWSH